MRTQRFGAVVAAGAGGGAIIVVPFDPDKVWGAKAEHHVNGTVAGRRVRVRLSPGGNGWAFTLSPARVRDLGLTAGDEVTVELTPEGPQRADLADDVSDRARRQPGRRGLLRHAGAVLPQGVPSLDRRDHPPAGPARGAHRRGR